MTWSDLDWGAALRGGILVMAYISATAYFCTMTYIMWDSRIGAISKSHKEHCLREKELIAQMDEERKNNLHALNARGDRIDQLKARITRLEGELIQKGIVI